MKCLVRDIPVHYEEAGTGRPLLMLHGWPTDHRHMVSDFEPLFENRDGWRRLYPDLPGMGQTPGANWITRHDDLLEVVLGFIDSVAPGERFVLAGTSYGGFLARGVLHVRQAQMEVDFQAALRSDEQDLRNMLVVQNRESLESFRKHIAPAIAAADHEFLKRITGDFAFDINVLADPFLAPTLMVAGRQDSVCGYHGAGRLLDECPRGTLAVLDRAGHALGVEQKTLFRALASEWLDRVEEYAPIIAQ